MFQCNSIEKQLVGSDLTSQISVYHSLWKTIFNSKHSLPETLTSVSRRFNFWKATQNRHVERYIWKLSDFVFLICFIRSMYRAEKFVFAGVAVGFPAINSFKRPVFFSDRVINANIPRIKSSCTLLSFQTNSLLVPFC